MSECQHNNITTHNKWPFCVDCGMGGKRLVVDLTSRLSQANALLEHYRVIDRLAGEVVRLSIKRRAEKDRLMLEPENQALGREWSHTVTDEIRAIDALRKAREEMKDG